MPLTTVTEPTFVAAKNGVTIATFDGNNAALPSALGFAAGNHFGINYLVSPPRDSKQVGFQKIETSPHKHEIAADGILITKGQAAGMYSMDCPILFLVDRRRNEGIFAHCGRPAMTMVQYLMNRDYNVVTAALNTLRGNGSQMGDLTAYITAGICQKCFTHDVLKDAALLAPFKQRRSWSVNDETGGLDLIGFIQAQLFEANIEPREIIHDGHCTKQHPRLASKRGGDTKSNLVVACIH